MGYDTDYKGVLLFEPHTKNVIALVDELLERSDINLDPDYPSDMSSAHVFSALDLELNHEKEGLCWRGGERSYDLHTQINILVHMVRQKFPDFKISGGSMEMLEECGDPLYIIPKFDGTVMCVNAEIVPKLGKPALDFIEGLWGEYGAAQEHDLETLEEKVFRQELRDRIDAMSDQMHGKRCDNCAPYIDIS